MSLSRTASPTWRASVSASSSTLTAPRAFPSLRLMTPRSVSAVTSLVRSPPRRADSSICSACARGQPSSGANPATSVVPSGDAARVDNPSTRNSRGPILRCCRASGHRDRTRSSSRPSAGSSGQTSRQSTARSPHCSTDPPSGSTKERFAFPSPNRPSSLPTRPCVLRRAWIFVAGVEQRPPSTTISPRATLPMRSQERESPPFSDGSQTISRPSSDSRSRRIPSSRVISRQSMTFIRAALSMRAPGDRPRTTREHGPKARLPAEAIG